MLYHALVHRLWTGQHEGLWGVLAGVSEGFQEAESGEVGMKANSDCSDALGEGFFVGSPNRACLISKGGGGGTEVYTVRRLWERSREDAAWRDGPRADMDVAADA